MNFFHEAVARGFVHQVTEGLVEAIDEPLCGYVGFDCTADSLHVGNLTSLMLLRLFVKHGHWPICLIGGATSRIGDPSGKDEARTMLDDAAILTNGARIGQFLLKFFNPQTFSGSVPILATQRRIFEIINNKRWYDSEAFSGMGFLTKVGPHISVNRMLAQESIRRRLDREQSLSLLEFSYLAYQAYDFVHLHTECGCTVQMGGSDQYGNIVAGIDLGKKMHGAKLYGLTTPLITTASGDKMGKSAGNAVWLDADRTSPYDYWQFWRNTDDKDVIRFLKLFTEMPLDMIQKLECLTGQDINNAKVILANEATALCHGTIAAQDAQKAAESVFGQGGSDGLREITITLELAQEFSVPDLLVQAGLCESKSEGRRLIKEGGIYVGGLPFQDEKIFIPGVSSYPGIAIKLSRGKKNHVLVRFVYSTK